MHVISRVSQGSDLGPFLLIIFINETCLNLKHYLSTYQLCSNNLKVYYSRVDYFNDSKKIRVTIVKFLSLNINK